MGFFGFLKTKKREEKEEIKSLEIPELPPLKEPFEAKLPVFPGSEKFEENIDLPPLEPLEPLEIDEPIEVEPRPIRTEPRPIRAQMPIKLEPKPIELIKPKIEPRKDIPIFKPLPKEPEKELIKEAKPFPSFEKEVLKEPLFVKAHSFRTILEHINKSANSGRESRRIFSRIQEVEKEKSETFVKWHSALEDIQRRLIFIDKTLFE